MQGDQDRAGDEMTLGQLAESFFERGESLSLESGSTDADAAIGPVGYAALEPAGRASQALRASQAWLQGALAAAQPWVLWRLRLMQLRLAIAITGCAEHALRAMVTHALIPYKRVSLRPLLAARHPRLARASRVILVTAAANYSIAAVLAASFGL